MYTSTNKRANIKNFKGYYDNYSYKTKTQRIATATSSVILPGLGQAINGETSKGIAFLLASLLNATTFTLRGRKNKVTHWLIALALRAVSSFDAYKHF